MVETEINSEDAAFPAVPAYVTPKIQSSRTFLGIDNAPNAFLVAQVRIQFTDSPRK